MRRMPDHSRSPPITRPPAATPMMSAVSRAAFADAARRSACASSPLDEEQAVQVGAERLIGGGQPGGERGAGRAATVAGLRRSRTATHCRTSRSMSGVFRGRIVGVQPLQGGEPGVGRREQAGVERAEKP